MRVGGELGCGRGRGCPCLAPSCGHVLGGDQTSTIGCIQVAANMDMRIMLRAHWCGVLGAVRGSAVTSTLRETPPVRSHRSMIKVKREQSCVVLSAALLL